jgi:hypothetical protein
MPEHKHTPKNEIPEESNTDPKPQPESPISDVPEEPTPDFPEPCDESDLDAPELDSVFEPLPKPEDDKPIANTGCVDLMEQPDELPDKRITLQPADKGTPSDLRPQGNGWPTEKVEKPVITVNLVSPDNRRPALVKKVAVPGNVKEVLVRYRPIRPRAGRQITPENTPEFKDFNDGKPVDVTKTDIVFNDPKTSQPGVMIYEIQVTLLTPIKPDEPFIAKLQVHACIQDDLEFISKNDLETLVQDIKEAKLQQILPPVAA